MGDLEKNPMLGINSYGMQLSTEAILQGKHRHLHYPMCGVL